MQQNIYSPAGIRQALGANRAAPLKALGQNFLINESVAERMVAESGITGEDGALEIGPGAGALTQKLCAASKKVAAVELDRKMVELLKITAPSAAVIEGDALKVDLRRVISEQLSGVRRVFAFGNLPYYITTPLIMRFVEEDLPVDSLTAMVQREAAKRLCAQEGSRESGAVTLAVRYRCEPRTVFGVSRGSFYPVPGVDSSVISLTPVLRVRRPVSEKGMFAVVKAAFSQRRKTVLNSISGGLAIEKGRLGGILAGCGVDPASRAEALGIDQYISIADALCAAGLL